MRKSWTLLTVVVGALVACSDANPAGSIFAPQPVVAGRSGCHTVNVTLTLTPTGFRQNAGPITGDLQGTAEVQFVDVAAFTGVTNIATGNTTWIITGGSVPALIGTTFSTQFANRNILLPGAPIVKNIGTHRAAAGVAKANLEYTGETSRISRITQLDHHGVICTS